MPLDIQHLLSAAGGSIIGKVRLQKVVYLLDQMGMNSEYEFSYHHYGPYSADLASAVDDATIFDDVVERLRSRASDGVQYSVYELGDNAPSDNTSDLGDLDFDLARKAIAAMDQYSATVLELAATIHWIACVEGDGEWREELIRRKGIKAAGGRVDDAMKLLRQLRLPPAVR